MTRIKQHSSPLPHDYDCKLFLRHDDELVKNIIPHCDHRMRLLALKMCIKTSDYLPLATVKHAGVALPVIHKRPDSAS